MKQRPAETEEEVGLSPEELAALDAAMAEAERGEGTDAFEFLRQLRAGTWRDPGATTVDLVVASGADDKEYELTPEDEDVLEESIAEIARVNASPPKPFSPSCEQCAFVDGR
jgi:hypothetical protein